MNAKIRLFYCQVCVKGFKSITTFNSHQKSHFPKYQCLICYKMFTRNYLLEDHIRIHTGEKPFQCDHCDNSYRTKSSLRGHTKKIHEKEQKLLKKLFAFATPGSAPARPALLPPSSSQPMIPPRSPQSPPPAQPLSPALHRPLFRPWL